LRKNDFTSLQRITDYKAIYVQDATEKQIEKIDQVLAYSEPEFDGYGFIAPAATFHRFMTGLTGEKMSSSKPESAIFLTDTPEEAKKKIMHAKTGGAVSLEQQKKEGGNPDDCMIYELFLYHLTDDDEELHTIYSTCRNGDRMCGYCKKQAAERMGELLKNIAEKRAVAEEKIEDYLS
jgi:tryptophanyl-tRNA synthetase